MTTERRYNLFGYFVDIVDISIILVIDALLITGVFYFFRVLRISVATVKIV